MQGVIVSLAVIATATVVHAAPFQNPPVLENTAAADSGTVSVSLDLDWGEFDPGNDLLPNPLRTRMLGGSIPAPTVVVSPGDTLEVRFENKLTQQQSSLDAKNNGKTNRYTEPDVGNLHFHGGHVSGVLPADDVTLVVRPGESYDYTIEIPADHMPGLHWIHPHHHGATTLHLAGGAAGAFVVKDPEGYLPDQIANAPEQLMVFQYWYFHHMYEVAMAAGDKLLLEGLAGTGVDVVQMPSVFTVNGLYQPTLTIEQGQWQRWRILYAGWLDTALNLELMDENATDTMSNCEMHLLAKDGIYLMDYPRRVQDMPVPPGGRADIMIRCNEVGTTTLRVLSRDTMIVNVVPATDTDSTSEDLVRWTPERPEYLEDLSNVVASDGCQCVTKMQGYGVGESLINSRLYQEGNNFLHTTYLGAVVVRQLKGGTVTEHSYHQHVYPYQISGFGQKSANGVYQPYFEIGDWHDTWMDTRARGVTGQEITLKYKTTVFPGKIMVHCHNSMHADLGMLTKEYVRDVREGDAEAQCQCEIRGSIEGSGIVDVLDYGEGPKNEITNDEQADVDNKDDSSDAYERSAGAAMAVAMMTFAHVAL